MNLTSDRSLGQLLDTSFALYRAHLGLFLLLAAGVVIPVDLIVGGIGLGQLTAGYDESPSAAETLVPSAVSALVTVPLITAMQVRAILAIEQGRTPTAGEAVREGLDVFTPLLVVVVLAGLVTILGFLALIIPGIYLLTHLAVAAQVVAVEGRTGGEALRRSFELVRGNAWWTLGVLLVINLLAGIVGGIATLPAVGLAESSDSALPLLIAAIIVEPFTLSFQALATTVLFFTLVARSTGVGAADGPSGAGPGTAPSQDDAFRAPEAPWQPPGFTDLPPPPRPPAGWEPPRPGS
ncbi:hypothetical protein GKE82_01490 [Conexibacter sp. W3-3-2]|uniref:DUF7847 domain-containing protein n=1 Tax=Paraconexibacter algicola TaxID=2133960 RepID=A0A2T4UC63_9ACTN|nr:MULTISPECIES: hypothetical protein [Solirubrobacterales]MTD43012.1 hypothetical protein [Conexibacter sp. W3-3-2]PTL54781.1 hypothetical protein C7Y72_19500 [Paraconexibacter algicola]